MGARHLVTALCAALWLVAPAAAEPVAVGSAMPALTLEDQHGETHTLDASVRLVIFTREMGAGDMVKDLLAENGGEILSERGAIYVADVNRMPGLIRRMFALPSMRKRPYPMWLDTEGTATADLPAVEGKPTLLFLEDGKVKKIRNPGTGAELREALGLPPELPEDEAQ